MLFAALFGSAHVIRLGGGAICHPPLRTALAIAAAPTPTSPAAPTPTSRSTTAELGQCVYIEDTDAFGMVFYANYLRFYERAAVHLLGLQGCARARREGDLLVGVDAFKGMRYSAPAVLGDELAVCVDLKGQDELGRIAFGASLVRSSDGAVLNSCADLRLAFRSASDGTIEASPWPFLELNDEPPELALAAPTGLVADNVPATSSQPNGSLQADELGGNGGLTMHAACDRQIRSFEFPANVL
jgi:acyl-CoA thioesterase FadM